MMAVTMVATVQRRFDGMSDVRCCVMGRGLKDGG